MKKEKVYEMTNDFGKKYLQTWLKDQEFLGVEIPKENIRKELYLIYKYENGEIYVCVLPLAETNDDGCCSFGDLQYFANVFAQEESGIKILWNPLYANRFVSPWWRNDVPDEKKIGYQKLFNSIIEKYS